MGSDAVVAPGDILLGKYRVERVLGQGGMGRVVAARHLDLDELFAIKLMLPTGLESAEAVERFLREARAAAKLKGEHVAKVQDVGRLPDGTPYMLMEHLAGSDLRRLIREHGPLRVDDAVTYVLQACETLREAHALGIVHRDVKSANLFLTFRPNGTPCVKVLDFGISKQTSADAVGLTSTTLVGGSPLYMSPEQMRSAKYVDHRTDIWAIGIVLHELLTGATPFHAETITAVAGRVLQDDPEPPGQLRADVPPWLDAVILRCLAKHAGARFQSMDELMAALQGRAPAFAPLPAPSMPPMPPQGPPSFRTPLPSIAQPMSSTTAGFSQVSGAPPSRPAGPARHPGGIFVAGAAAALVVGLVVAVWVLASGPGGDTATGPEASPAGAGAAPSLVPAAAATSASGSDSPTPPAPSSDPAPGATAAPTGGSAAGTATGGTAMPAKTGEAKAVATSRPGGSSGKSGAPTKKPRTLY